MSQDRIDLILEMLRNNPADTFLRYAIALEYRKLGDDTKAMEFLNSLVKENPDYLPSYYQLGKLLEEKGQSELAIVIYRRGKEVAKQQNDTKTLGELSEALMILDVYDEEF